MTPDSPAADSRNWPDNTKAITADGTVNSSPTTESGHYAKILNAQGDRSANSGTGISNGEPNTTSSFQQAQNKAGDATGGLGGGRPRGGHS